MRIPLVSALLASVSLLAFAAQAAAAQPQLEIEDVDLGATSLAGVFFDLVRGNDIVVHVQGSPGDLVFWLLSTEPPPANPPMIGGVPLAVDPATLVVLLHGVSNPTAVFSVPITVPTNLALGETVYTQFALVDPATSTVRLSNGLELIVVDAVVFDFEAGLQGWTGDFADYPVGEEAFYELDWGWSSLPAPFGPALDGFRITGNNHSDDLFMFLKRQIGGLAPDRDHKLRFEVRFASDVAEDLFGVGGAPGSGVILLVGSTQVEPVKVIEPGVFPMYRMNIDKGPQGGGEDVAVVGHIGTPAGSTGWHLLEHGNLAPFEVASDSDGMLWLIIGTESGFEGITLLYYDRVVVKIFE
jgi:hypothetical protein